MTLYDQSDTIGGQFNLAKRVPGKEEFHETLRYFRNELHARGVVQRLGKRVDARALVDAGHDLVVLATGVNPRALNIDGADHPKVRHHAQRGTM